MDFAEQFDKYLDQNDLTRTEGETGVRNLDSLAKALGYTQSGFRDGVPLCRFLADNPGAIEAIHNWIRDTALPEWAEQLEVVDEEEIDV
jgi:hypothetical protein